MQDRTPEPIDFLDRLGWRARRRPIGQFSAALSGAAGALLAVGVVAIGIDRAEDGSGTAGAVLCGVLAVVALLAVRLLPPAARPACVSAIAICVPATCFFALTVDSSTSGSSVTQASFIAALFLTVVWAIGPVRGRAVLLGVALFLIWSALVGEVSNTPALVLVPAPEGTIQGVPVGPDTVFTQPTVGAADPGDPTTTGVVSIVIGGVFLVVAAVLDRRRYFGVATPFVAIGILAAVLGASIVGSDVGATGGGLIAFFIGLGIGGVATMSIARRGTAWLGAITAAVGLIFVVADTADDSAVTFGVLALLIGAALAVGAFVLSLAIGEDGDGSGVSATR